MAEVMVRVKVRLGLLWFGLGSVRETTVYCSGD